MDVEALTLNVASVAEVAHTPVARSAYVRLATDRVEVPVPIAEAREASRAASCWSALYG